MSNGWGGWGRVENLLLSFKAAAQVAAGELSPLIVGGIISTYGEHPYICTLQVFTAGSWHHYCGATIFNAHNVITSAHCADDPLKPRRIQCGKYRLQSTDEHEVTINIKTHEDWLPTGDGFPNDIALCHTETAIPFSDFIHPLDIDDGSHGDWVGSECKVTGWGVTASGAPANYLKKLNMTVLSNEVCEEEIGTMFGAVVYPFHICAKANLGQDTCSQDSGGPTRCYSGGRWIIVGSTSWGIGCEGRYPAVSIRLSSFYQWLVQHATS
ncbi:hypothetical protein C0Q70_20089 [Pomacea canaliculata]|uniref:Peptidase S1 domain-containing protein n=1 Tax=Pomacea canaliculata TaxID=400727 RepID=A0A2T7NEJ1_POMCA|nr:hypothetical protein C0Q70_20089 [Pomacea canaliculata]